MRKLLEANEDMVVDLVKTTFLKTRLSGDEFFGYVANLLKDKIKGYQPSPTGLRSWLTYKKIKLREFIPNEEHLDQIKDLFQKYKCTQRCMHRLAGDIAFIINNGNTVRNVSRIFVKETIVALSEQDLGDIYLVKATPSEWNPSLESLLLKCYYGQQSFGEPVDNPTPDYYIEQFDRQSGLEFPEDFLFQVIKDKTRAPNRKPLTIDEYNNKWRLRGQVQVNVDDYRSRNLDSRTLSKKFKFLLEAHGYSLSQEFANTLLLKFHTN